MDTERRPDSLKTEIEQVIDRVREDRIKYLEEALQRQDNAIIEKDAEIERLKAELRHAKEMT